VYEKNSDYLPRAEVASGSTGGKRAKIERVIWRYVPDPCEAAELLNTGEVDWWQEPPIDSMPKLQQHPDLETFLFDPMGAQG